MHLKKLIVILVALGFLIPVGSSAILENHHEDELVQVYIDGFIFAIGKVANLTEHKSGYSTPWYTVECVDVYCIQNLRDRPIIQHLTNHEEIEVDQTRLFYGGIRTPPFIVMWPRLLFPLIELILTYC